MLQFDRVNIRTAKPDRARRLYERVLGMTSGWRPDFPFPGHWMYLGKQVYVHLVAVDQAPDTPKEAPRLRLEHVAFTGQDLEEHRQRLKDEGVACDEVRVPGTDLLQSHFDPDGNRICVDFQV